MTPQNAIASTQETMTERLLRRGLEGHNILGHQTEPALGDELGGPRFMKCLASPDNEQLPFVTREEYHQWRKAWRATISLAAQHSRESRRALSAADRALSALGIPHPRDVAEVLAHSNARFACKSARQDREKARARYSDLLVLRRWSKMRASLLYADIQQTQAGTPCLYAAMQSIAGTAGSVTLIPILPFPEPPDA